MNDTDTRILQHLMEDGSKSNVEIAKAIGVVEETVRRRKVSLQRDGAYETMAVPDYRKLGYGVEVLLGIESDSIQMDEIAEDLSELEVLSPFNARYYSSHNQSIHYNAVY